MESDCENDSVKQMECIFCKKMMTDEEIKEIEILQEKQILGDKAPICPTVK